MEQLINRRRGMYDVPLPSTYTRIEYIENNSNTAYINTEVIPDDSFSCNIEVQIFEAISGKQTNPLIGTRANMNDDGRVLIMDVGVAINRLGSFGRSENGSGNFGNNKIYNDGLVHNVYFSIKDKIAKCDNEEYDLKNTVYNISNCPTIFLFYLNGYSDPTPTSNYGRGRIYSCSMYSDDRMIRNFVPCIDNNGIAGLYDTVEDKFYTSENDDLFVAGPVIAFPYDAIVEYLEDDKMNGSCRINTDYIPTGNDNTIILEAMCLSYPNNNAYIPWVKAVDKSANNCFTIAKGNSNSRLAWQNGTRSGVNSYGNVEVPELLGKKHKIILYPDCSMKVDDTTFQAYPIITGTENTAPFTLFGGDVLDYDASKLSPHLRIYSFKWVKGNETILDLIPVRKDNVGYLYNKVDGKLYGATEGKFIIGPDIN